ncbi:MAG TPA: alpha-1,4-glucan--maltose-1-phosphate maltosyltransferase [Rhodocyclaceae bacterium]|nr:alpha-1,4-glucan--maltose-1-phosphate maltosyltransferase [Rhodocyclaceae bacterium]
MKHSLLLSSLADEAHAFETKSDAPILSRNLGMRAVKAALAAPRLAIEKVTPSVDEGRFAVKRIVGETVHVEADVFMDGHDSIAVSLLWRAADVTQWNKTRMVALGNDRWAADFPLGRMGRYLFTIEAWRDTWATMRGELMKKNEFQQNIALEITEAIEFIEQTAQHLETAHEGLKNLTLALKEASTAKQHDVLLALLLDEQTAAILSEVDHRPFLLRLDTLFPVDSERREANFSSWYELFPRSQGTTHENDHGNFDDVIARLPAIRDMGFDVLYFPPIHPIGMTYRKGRNNHPAATAEDIGSPYAIGSAEGGHDAIDSKLGTFEDFSRLLRAAEEHGLEIALDFAIQCSPDHPWLRGHPEWFLWRSDGSIRHAENPPKKYEDIINVDFYAGGINGPVAPNLWLALRDVVLFWVRQGIRIFRVDNPHTKPLSFWQWLIAEVRGKHSDVIFLSEAFTRPKVMARLAKIGYSQSYTYFIWRETKAELMQYLNELNAQPLCEFFRPHFFVNTPDINPWFLQRSGRAGFVIRAALAGLLSGLWGMYSGFELCEAAALPGKEEYLDSEKYQIKVRDWQQPGNIISEIALINRIRRANPALQTHLGLEFHNADNDQILYCSKSTANRDNVILIAINLDPFSIQESHVEAPLWKWGLSDDGELNVEDLVSGNRWTWRGKHQSVRLDPAVLPFLAWRITATSMRAN